MANPVDELVIAITAETDDAVKGIKDVDKALDDTQKKAEETKKASNGTKEAFGFLRGATTALTLALAGLGATLLGIFTGVRNFDAFIAQANQLELLTMKTGVSARELDAWSKAAEAAGGSSQALQQSLASFYAKTGREATEFFKLADKIEGMGEGQKRRYLQAMGVNLDALPLFMRGKDEVAKLVARYRRDALSAEDIRKARQFKMIAHDFNDLLVGIGNTISRAMLPVNRAIVETLRDATNWLRENARWIGAVFITLLTMKLAPTILAIASAAATATTAFGFLGGKLLMSALAMNGTFIPAIKALIPLLGYLGKTIAASFLPITLFVAAVAAVALVLEDLYVFAQGGDSLFGSMFADDAETLEAVRDAVSTVIDTVSELWKKIKDSGIISGIFKGLAIAVLALANVITFVIGWVTKLFVIIGKLWDWISEKFNGIKKFFGDIGSAFGSIIPKGILNVISPSDNKNAENVSAEQARYQNNSSSVNTNANVTVNNNFPTTPSNPQAYGQAVGRTVIGAGRQTAKMVGNSYSGVNLVGG